MITPHTDVDIVPADPRHVDQLTRAMQQALERTAIDHITTPADVLSAVFTLLDHLLRATRLNQTPAESVQNRKEIKRVLTEMLVEFGSPVH